MAFLSLEEFIHSNFFIALYCERIPQTQGGYTTHSGVIYKTKQGTLMIFHFAWHKMLMCSTDIPRNKSVYIGLKDYDSKLDSRRLKTESLINLFIEVYSKNKGSISYGLVLSKLTAFMGGFLETKEGSIGLTCSTFIMVFFKSYDKELINIESWKQRKVEDNNWKQFMIKFMREHKVEEEHIKLIEKENVMFRFKPEEVISSGLKYPENLTAEFNFCESNGKLIKKILSH